MLNVADVSSNNGADISQIVANSDVIIVKATEGDYYTNEYFQTQVKQVQDSGKRLGLYLFVNGGVNADRQAQYFLDAIGQLSSDDQIPLIIDFENRNGISGYPTLTGNEPKAISSYLYNKTGKKAWLYISNSDLHGGGHNYSWDDMSDYPLWLAGYPYYDGRAFSDDVQKQGDELYFDHLAYWSTVTMWQYDAKPYDRSVFYGDLSTWDTLSKRVTPQPNPSPVVPNPTPTPLPTPERPSTDDNGDRKGLHMFMDDFILKINKAVTDFINRL
ncbi:glycoside hydrolase family 25 protein [Fructobacillus sp. CRL 2054]|uniref:glycoside hydrolase family 25 protein n=1 Tax=Fructobacillus sp. CRL 2054 TaxID=2763007 RepID=UPI00237937D7|nr:glycoside hydrolase family 25 protein [Fructobacillus sp. CRL 2054]MDD9139202.1 glycoside hydrolase family 25 protein [Fructobacillus sp. CRL 2054]